MLLDNNSYMIYIIRNPIFWLGISAYGGGVLSIYFPIDDVHRTTFICFENLPLEILSTHTYIPLMCVGHE
jgi:hypothetical protein